MNYPTTLSSRSCPHRYEARSLALLYGALTLCLGFVHGTGSFVGVRALLSVTESGLLPGMVLYLSHFYRREELEPTDQHPLHRCILSGAFGDLLARGLSAIGPAGAGKVEMEFSSLKVSAVLCGVISYHVAHTE